MLYGKPTKLVRHHDEDTLTIEPQRFEVHRFWAYNDTGTTRTDGLDLQDEKTIPLGSKISNHKMEMLVTPETIEPQQIYMGTIALSFADIYHHSICGGRFEQASYGDTATENFAAKTNPISCNIFPDVSATDAVTFVNGHENPNREIGGTGSGYGITELKLDDHFKHWVRLKKLTVFDQRPLVSDRKQPIPSKVKRSNEGMFYGLFIFNDSQRGATPADTQITVNIKSSYTEMAI